MSKHIIALSIFAAFADEFLQADFVYASHVKSIGEIEDIELQFDCIDYSILRLEHLIEMIR